MKQAWKYREATVEPQGGNAIDFGDGKHLPSYWKVTTPDTKWVLCATKEDCRRFIDKWHEKNLTIQH